MVLTTEALVVEKPVKEAAAPDMGGMGGMGGSWAAWVAWVAWV
jgi:chaperonin GroEL